MKMSGNMYIGFTVTGPTGEIARFREEVRGQDANGEEITIDFNRLIPTPEEITDPIAGRFVQREDNQWSYSASWCERNWGASSNALFTEILQNSDGVFGVQFDIAGNFPYAVIEKMVASFPALVFDGSAFENGEEFYMTFEGRNGKFTWQDGDYREAFGKDAEDVFEAPTTGAASS
jgi:hypothetical protein